MVDVNGNKTGGRKKGVKNRADAALRAQFEFFLTHASEDIVKLFDQLKAENPKQALDAIRDYAEFVLPKLARTELTGKNGGDFIVHTISAEPTAEEWVKKHAASDMEAASRTTKSTD